MEDSARKAGEWVVGKLMDVSVIFLEDLINMVKGVKKFLREFRDGLYLMQYRRVQYWVEWEAGKHGLKVVYVAHLFSTQCPKYVSKTEGVAHRYFRCVNCGYDKDRDVVAVMDLYGKGL
ncbi:IS200/IS605 family element transposase accessory protein TnpB [Metallosphaera tengchongensis]|uniref:IS200/IS605 family element transposase accessory protein TnpB n=1 Tax=Metallosphaera tengchongensis TaxID=1532350 RepID=A0A6N0NZE6_9CREN|nr:zinc ribbon domain-containing protein [Metallosphaera tengchongensis]QKR00511.1 IS200/IS605 family element transposase accessory protein TnpB [Metallosphaera tengchongensis]